MSPHRKPAPAPTDVNPPRRRLALGLVCTLMLMPALPACAVDARAQARPLEVSIIDRESGQPLTVYRKDGRAHVAGQPASRYAIRLLNRSAERVLVVLSVDGVNVVSGETAAFGQTGYVLDPWRTYDIAGWRKSDTAVAAFEFAALAESYAARTGRAGNVGVIGAAVFVEKPLPQAVAPLPSPQTAANAMDAAREQAQRSESAKAAAPAAEMRLGTAHGQREWSVTTRTHFERQPGSPQQVLEIAYDSHANLVAAGVIIVRPVAQARPRAFPHEDTRGYVPDPPR